MLHFQAERLVTVLIHSKIPELLMAAGLGQLLNWPSLQQVTIRLVGHCLHVEISLTFI